MSATHILDSSHRDSMLQLRSKVTGATITISDKTPECHVFLSGMWQTFQEKVVHDRESKKSYSPEPQRQATSCDPNPIEARGESIEATQKQSRTAPSRIENRQGDSVVRNLISHDELGHDNELDDSSWPPSRKRRRSEDRKCVIYGPAKNIDGTHKQSGSLEQHRQQTDISQQFDHCEHTLAILYRWTKCRIAAGMYDQSIMKIHDMLQEEYKNALSLITDVETIEQKDQEGSIRLVRTRTKIAALWCMFAHSLVDICQQRMIRRGDRASKKRKKGGRVVAVTHSTLLDKNDEFLEAIRCAVKVLSSARDCPLVGNHQYVAVALSRLLVAGQARALSLHKAEASIPSDSIIELLSLSIATCWKTIEVATEESLIHRNPQDNWTASAISLIDELEIVPHAASREIPGAVDRITALPSWLRTSLSISCPLVNDRNSIREVCQEANRMSRLKEKVLSRCEVSVSSKSTGTFLDQFLLFRFFDCPSELPPPGAVWSNLEYAPRTLSKNSGTRNIQWTWQHEDMQV